ncbi:MAG TPA: 6-phosphofructokinase [Anaerolineae bacterium]|nr:6-phosphofructokinase [Anaerolineae bacterium]
MTSFKVGVLTSGGDSPGMNAAVRAVVRGGLSRGAEIYGIYEGWQGAVDGGDKIKPLGWRSAGGILQKGGTVLGTARSADFRAREGRKKAAFNLYSRGITGLVVIGGDGSLTGALTLCNEWVELIDELAAEGKLDLAAGETVAPLRVVGLPGSIDNDLYGTDISIGADTALQTIVRAVDQLESTAASHQRTFIVEVMGRNCGYLALTSALASGGHWVLIPEEEMEPRWHQKMVKALQQGREAGRRHVTVIVAEGARHPDGLPIRAETIQQILQKQMNVDARVTVLGHVQRGGAASAFDRILATRLGVAAIDDLLDAPADTPPRMIGLVNNTPTATRLEEVISKSQAVGKAIEEGVYSTALSLRGSSFHDQLGLLKILTQATPAPADSSLGTIAIVTAGADAPGMNAAARVAVRRALNAGARVVGGINGFRGMVRGQIEELNWMSVSSWVGQGGTKLGSGRYDFEPDDFAQLERVLQQHAVRGMLVLGGLNAYKNVAELVRRRNRHPGFNIPIVCLPTTIDNSVPATDYAVGADTALNNIIEAVDKIKDTAGSTHRAFIVEVMGDECGYLPLMSALACGAERAYLPEDGIALDDLADDVQDLRDGFRSGKSLGIFVMGESASRHYNTDVIRRVMQEEGQDEFEVRACILGHVQRGGAPTPFDRIQASRFANHAVMHLMEQIREDDNGANVIGLLGKRIEVTPLDKAMALLDPAAGRPIKQWWYDLNAVLERLSLTPKS